MAGKYSVVYDLVMFQIEYSLIKVLGSIPEVPISLSDNKQNLIIICLWHSPRQPSAEQLFGKGKKEFIHIFQTGNGVDVDGLCGSTN